MIYSYAYTLCRRAVVVTCDLSAANLQLLRSNHWLKDPRNVVTLWLTEDVRQGVAIPPQPSAREAMAAWTVQELTTFLNSKDLLGPAAHLADNGVNGHDLLDMTLDTLTTDLRCTPFASRKVLRARDAFLEDGL